MLDKKKGTDKGQEQKASKNVQSTGVERKHPCETLCPSEGEIPGEYWVQQTSSAAQRHLVIGTSVPQNKPHGLKALPFCFLADGSGFKLTPSIPSLLDANMYPRHGERVEKPHGGHCGDTGSTDRPCSEQTRVGISAHFPGRWSLPNDTSPTAASALGHWGDDVVPCWEEAAGTAWQRLGVLPARPWPGQEAPTQHQQHLLQLPLPGREVELLRVEPQLLGPAGEGERRS